MNNLLNEMKIKFNSVKNNVKVRTAFISIFALLLIVCITFAWYINNLSIFGMEFETGSIEFNTYVYNEDGKRLVGPISSNDEDESKYINAPLLSINNAKVGSRGTAYIAVESTGSLGIKYKIAFDVTGRSESATTYLGGYKYNISKVTDTAVFSKTDDIDVSSCPEPNKINNEIVTIDKNPVVGIIEKNNGYDVFRVDYTLVNKNEEYSGKTINIYYNIFATQVDGNFEGDVEERGYTYYCSTKEDIDRAKVEAYPGDIIKLSSDIVYYGDLVLNKPISFEANDYTLTVNGNLLYDYVLGNTLKINVGGLGRLVVKCTKDGIGGNFTIKAPLSDVVLTGSNSSNGDIVVDKKITVDATNVFGSPGVSFNNIRIVDDSNSLKTVLLDSNTRATVSFGTKIGMIQSLVKSSNIEIVNNGVINKIDLSNMKLLNQTNSPQIYILNNNDINNAILLPVWSEKFVEDASGNCSGNTRIIQSISGSPMEVSGSCPFDNDDIEVEKKDTLVEQIEQGNDSGLKIYYQDTVDANGNTVTNSIRSILEDYFENDATTECTISEVLRLEIISIGLKAITNADIAFMNSNDMLALEYLDMERANIYDTSTNTDNRLPASAFMNVKKYNNLILPQSLVEIGDSALRNMVCENIITIPSNVSVFGNYWFYSSYYVYFASSVPVSGAASGLNYAKAIFVDEPYITSYKNVYSGYSTKIYPVSVLDESKRHFIRNVKNDEWEITYYISGEESVIGENITLDGSVLKVTSIYDNAYRHNFTGSIVNFSDTVENIGGGNFYNNKNITEVNLNKIKNIGASTFSNCSNLVEVIFGDSLEIIDSNAFESCVSLSQEIELPESMNKIASGAFQSSAITRINTGGTTSIDGRAFYSCTSLVSAELPNVKVIAESGTNEVFYKNISLVSVDMPMVSNVSGNFMFAYCTSLRELYMGANDDGVSLGGNTFYGDDTTKIKLFVPKQHIDFYKDKQPGGVNAIRIYPEGEKMGDEFVNGFNIGKYIILDNKDNTYSLITSNINYSGSLVIPNEYNSKPITAIYANAFRNQSFTDVNLTIGNNIKTIGDSAFRGRSGLLNIVFGDSLETIGSYAFAECLNLSQNIKLPDSMKAIETGSFYKTGITGINTGGTSSIEGRAFYSCTSLVYSELPNVMVIAESGTNEVFAYNTSMVSVDMPMVSKVSGNNMFMYCTSLTELYMGTNDSSITLGGNAFIYGDTAKLKLYVPQDLVSFYIGRNIVGSGQVYPKGEKIGNKTVNGFTVGDYILLDNNDNTYTFVTSNLDYSGSVEVPDEYNGKPITDIYANAFRNQTFTSANLQLGSNVKVIGDRAFYGRTGLNTVTLDNVTTIGVEAFYGSGISVLNGPKLTSIGNNAFRNCTNLGVINLPKIESINSSYAFAQCTNLKSVYFENIMSTSLYTFYGCKQLEKITINKIINSNKDNMPSTMTIDASAPCKIYVPYHSLSYYGDTWSGKPVVTFDTAAMYNDDTYILAENNEGKWELIDFVPSTSRDSLSLPSEVSTDSGESLSIYSIKFGALATVSDTLKNLTLSSSIAKLDNEALCECSSIENIYTESENVFFTSVNGVLYSKDKKMLIKYPVGRSGAFDMSSNDYSLTVGIGAHAFANACDLKEITFPSSLLVIDSTSFANCGNLKTVEFTGETPPTLMGSSIFDTGVDSFKMIIPTSNSDVVTSYLCALNFAEYEPYIDIGENSAPSSSTNRNQVPIGDISPQKSEFALLKTGKDEDEEETEDSSNEDTTSGDDPNKSQNTVETQPTESEEISESTTE